MDSAAHSQWHEPVKICATTGRKPKAGNYELAVQKVLTETISLYRGYLSTGTPYPSPMDEMRWAKKSWQDACKECETQIRFNHEIIKLVRDMAN